MEHSKYPLRETGALFRDEENEYINKKDERWQFLHILLNNKLQLSN